MDYLKGWSESQLDGELTRLGNELTNKLILKNGISWSDGSWWIKPEWNSGAKDIASKMLIPTKELDDILMPQKQENLVVMQVRWGNHVPGDVTHFPTPACKFREILDHQLPMWGKPKVYLASDCLDKTLMHFEDYDIICSDSIIGVEHPCMIDYWMMVNCNKLICSNSSLPWAASLINEKCDFFVRPNDHDRFVMFEPWNSSPCVKLAPELVNQNKQDFRDQGRW